MRFAVPRVQKVADGIIGVLSGALYGALLGIMVVAFIGAVLGGIVGVILRRLFQGREWLVLRVFPKGILFAPACGVTAQAFYMDRAAATTGLAYGTLIGLGCGLLVCLVAFPFAVIAIRTRSP
jgi:tetrahydromethanopterin S-methyltransferase subunit B